MNVSLWSICEICAPNTGTQGGMRCDTNDSGEIGMVLQLLVLLMMKLVFDMLAKSIFQSVFLSKNNPVARTLIDVSSNQRNLRHENAKKNFTRNAFVHNKALLAVFPLKHLFFK